MIADSSKVFNAYIELSRLTGDKPSLLQIAHEAYHNPRLSPNQKAAVRAFIWIKTKTLTDWPSGLLPASPGPTGGRESGDPGKAGRSEAMPQAEAAISVHTGKQTVELGSVAAAYPVVGPNHQVGRENPLSLNPSSPKSHDHSIPPTHTGADPMGRRLSTPPQSFSETETK